MSYNIFNIAHCLASFNYRYNLFHFCFQCFIGWVVINFIGASMLTKYKDAITSLGAGAAAISMLILAVLSKLLVKLDPTVYSKISLEI